MPVIDRREFLGALGAAVPAKSARRPNLLFVMSDQQSSDMLGCYGNEQIKTPHLDRFAADGVRFNHCISSYPLCTPYRAMLMSGQHPLYNGGITNDLPLLANNGKYFPNVLADAGYRLGYVGKWHLLGGDRRRPIPPGPMRYGFGDEFWTNNCHVDFRPGKCFFWNREGKQEFFDEWEVYGQTRQALRFLDGCSPENPFALFVSWHPPHDWGRQPHSLVYLYDSIPELMSLYDPAKLRLRPGVQDSPQVRRAYHGYYAMCSGVDTAFGWLTKKLEEKGLADNTIVVFTADHGDNLTSHGHTVPKSYPEDTSARVPLLIRYPKRLRAGRKTDLLTGSMDLMPTLVSMMGLDVPGTVQGRNLWPHIESGKDDAVESVPLFYLANNWRGLYTGRYTYAFGQGPQFVMGANGRAAGETRPADCLYDRGRDPDQLRNLYADSGARAVRDEMHRLTRKWMERFEDTGLGLSEIRPLYGSAGDVPGDTRDPNFRGRPIDVIRRARKG